MTSRPTALVATAAAAAFALAACSSGTTAADGPVSGNVTMVVPFSAGGGSDASGRAIASGLEGVTGLTITTENREGGSGAVGYSYFLGEEGNPNVLLAAETSLISIPLSQDVEFESTSFTPIMKLGDDYTLMVVPADSPYETCTDVIEAAEDGRVVAAVSGAVSLDEVVFSLVEEDQGVEFDRVPFESGAEVIAGVLGGQVDIASLNPGEVVGQLESGDMRALCAFSEERYEYEAIADVPTATEQGIDVAFAQFRGFIAPGGLTEEQTQFWIDAAEEFAETEAYDEYIEANLMQPNVLYGEEFAEYVAGNEADLETALGQ
ncbi:tripartite tricarboxylate transporter substrate binding protein [Agrococcus sp. SGAir0287]|uniref:tripartite tricarboxylate transporter substrate binding protein n=1 Tax=Agrococcus sp. SGAir0287 TaxID=2070347 RepID=UPI0010CCD607|nr:tripartite tricarboxylate transporter substrate binding protein [Agrococcus sp. SGAir0287]QCR19786.1 tripartite tricarboxylate transporter substrate binding protein [Agrococcus sp. SGAir0287]